MDNLKEGLKQIAIDLDGLICIIKEISLFSKPRLYDGVFFVLKLGYG